MVGLFTTEASACLTVWEKLPYATAGGGSSCDLFEMPVGNSLAVSTLGLWPV